MRSLYKYAVDNLVESLINVQISKSCPQICILPFYERIIDANIEDPYDLEDSLIPIYLYKDQISNKADLVFSVSGDSMEPTYHDGTLVLVEKIPDAPDLCEGETGAFIIGNKTFIKIYAEDGLHSLNPQYPVMKFGDIDTVHIIGRVLEILDPSSIASETDIVKFEEFSNAVQE